MQKNLCDCSHWYLKSNLSRLFFCRHALNVQIFLKMHRSDYAERQLRMMQQVDEDHTLTQLANAWLNLSVVYLFIYLFLLFFLWVGYCSGCSLHFSMKSGWLQDTGSISHLSRFLWEVSDDEPDSEWESCLLHAHGKLWWSWNTATWSTKQGKCLMINWWLFYVYKTAIIVLCMLSFTNWTNVNHFLWYNMITSLLHALLISDCVYWKLYIILGLDLKNCSFYWF